MWWLNVFATFSSLFFSSQSAELVTICKDGICMWSGGGLYKGCIENAYIVFNFFDSSGVMDSVQVVTVESTNLGCKDMAMRVMADNPTTFYLGELQTECVSYYYLNIIVNFEI